MRKFKVDIVVPVLNEEGSLAASIERLYQFLKQHSDWNAEIIIADNGSTDQTPNIAAKLAKHYKNVSWFQLEERGSRIAEIPVDWKDDPDSRVRILDTVKKDLMGLIRLKYKQTPPRPENW